MNNSPPDRIARALTDLLGFAAEVREYVIASGEQNLYDHRPTQLVTEALLHRIGEVVARLPDDFTAAHEEVAWRQMKGMRNVVAHQYGYVDYRIVWRALSQNLPRDVAAIRQILDTIQDEPTVGERRPLNRRTICAAYSRG